MSYQIVKAGCKLDDDDDYNDDRRKNRQQYIKFNQEMWKAMEVRVPWGEYRNMSHPEQ